MHLANKLCWVRLASLYPTRSPSNNKRILRLIIKFHVYIPIHDRVKGLVDLTCLLSDAMHGTKLCTLLSAAPSRFEELHLFPSRHSRCEVAALNKIPIISTFFWPWRPGSWPYADLYHQFITHHVVITNLAFRGFCVFKTCLLTL